MHVVCEYLRVEVRGQPCVYSLVTLHLVFWDRISHMNLQLTIWPGCQARELQGFACLCLPGASTGVTDTSHHIYMGTKDQTG